jgi:protein arginine kinase
MTIAELMKQSGAWLRAGAGAEVVISSRIRLARNLEGAAFPGWAGEEECVRLCDRIAPLVAALPALKEAASWDMGALAPIEKELLHERHLISNELAARGRGSMLIMRRDETLGVMINEEDHLRIQAMSPGMEIAALWQEIDRLDTELSAQVRYAFSPRLGFLTACPTNVGTGLRASVMLHLPALRVLKEMDPVIKGLGKIGLAVRGLQGEGTEASGNMFQVSNQTTLGESEQTIVSRLIAIVAELVAHETNARLRLMEAQKTLVYDIVGRAYGVLTQAYVLSSREALDMLSGLRLGVEMGLVRQLDIGLLNRLMLVTQPGHLQQFEGREVSAAERDQLRARLIREQIRQSGAVLAATA